MNAKQLTVSGGNLFAIASQQYGDGTLWAQIAQANGLVDPVITGTVTLIIPANPVSTGGVRFQ
jgi:nucleoid-associated protein YgaU